MELADAVRARKSIRGFLAQPVPRLVLEQILELAAHAPSWENTQPWEVAVIGGEVMKQVKEALYQTAASGATPTPHIPFPRFVEPYLSRRRELGYSLYGLLGIKRDDMPARQAWALRGRKFFDAPNGLIFYMSKELGEWALLDLGMFIQNVMLTAVTFGLGTCPQAAVVAYPQVLRQILGIPDDKRIICGMAIGYPDWQHPANKLETTREPLASFTRWCGF